MIVTMVMITNQSRVGVSLASSNSPQCGWPSCYGCAYDSHPLLRLHPMGRTFEVTATPAATAIWATVLLIVLVLLRFSTTCLPQLRLALFPMICLSSLNFRLTPLPLMSQCLPSLRF